MDLRFGRFTKSCSVTMDDGQAVFYNRGECASWTPVALARLIDADVVEEITAAEMQAEADALRAKLEAAQGLKVTVGVVIRGRPTEAGSRGGVPIGPSFYQVGEKCWVDPATAESLVHQGVAERI